MDEVSKKGILAAEYVRMHVDQMRLIAQKLHKEGKRRSQVMKDASPDMDIRSKITGARLDIADLNRRLKKLEAQLADIRDGIMWQGIEANAERPEPEKTRRELLAEEKAWTK